MQYAIFLCFIGAVLILLGALERGWFFLLFWFGMSFVWLGVAHVRGIQNAFRKQPDGIIPLWVRILHLPFICYTSMVWHCLRILSKEPPHNQVTEHLVVGRRLLNSELNGEFVNYIDLTSEFSEPCKARSMRGYVCFPILDAGAPSPDSLRALLANLAPGKTYVHCAQGHGRTGLFALAFLLANGISKTVEEGMHALRGVRPGIRLNAQQQRCIQLLTGV